MTTYTQNDVLYHLGYPESQLLPNPDANGNPLPFVTNNVGAVIDRLVGIDTGLDQAALDSMATAVGDLKVDFVRGSWMLKLEGSRQLGLLASLTGVPIYYDRFKGRKPTDPSVTPLAVKAGGSGLPCTPAGTLSYQLPQTYFNI